VAIPTGCRSIPMIALNRSKRRAAALRAPPPQLTRINP